MAAISRVFGSYFPGVSRVVALDGEFQSFELRPEQQVSSSGLPLHWNDFHRPPASGTAGPFSFMKEVGVIVYSQESETPSFKLDAAITRHLPLLYNYTAPAAPYDEPEAIQAVFCAITKETRDAMEKNFKALSLKLPNLGRSALPKLLAANQGEDAQRQARRVHAEITEKRAM